MIQRTQLTVALDILIEYLLQEASTPYPTTLDRPSADQPGSIHEVGSYAAAELTADTEGSALATES
jgi:hypothetical protein